MKDKVLVTYASRFGSTAGVAEVIGKTLADNGTQVDVLPMREVKDLSALVCMTLSMRNGKQYRSHVSTWLNPVRALVTPISEGLFAGALDIKKIPSVADRLKFQLSVLSGVWKEGDHRDWGAICKWALDVKPLLTK